jgi:uncharacterized membrane protein YkvA (DUF1232 family)
MKGKDAFRRLRERAHRLKREVYALYLAIRDRETPWYAKLLGAIVVGYALSPIDLIPDFIPILGQLDDLILVPVGISLVLRLIPAPILERSRRRAEIELSGKKLVSKLAAAIIVAFWLTLIGLLLWK